MPIKISPTSSAAECESGEKSLCGEKLQGLASELISAEKKGLLGQVVGKQVSSLESLRINNSAKTGFKIKTIQDNNELAFSLPRLGQDRSED